MLSTIECRPGIRKDGVRFDRRAQDVARIHVAEADPTADTDPRKQRIEVGAAIELTLRRMRMSVAEL
jgi:hypothetical protein